MTALHDDLRYFEAEKASEPVKKSTHSVRSILLNPQVHVHFLSFSLGIPNQCLARLQVRKGSLFQSISSSVVSNSRSAIKKNSCSMAPVTGSRQDKPGEPLQVRQWP